MRRCQARCSRLSGQRQQAQRGPSHKQQREERCCNQVSDKRYRNRASGDQRTGTSGNPSHAPVRMRRGKLRMLFAQLRRSAMPDGCNAMTVDKTLQAAVGHQAETRRELAAARARAKLACVKLARRNQHRRIFRIVTSPQRQHSESGRAQQAFVIESTVFARHFIERLKRNSEMPRQRRDIVMFGNRTGGNQRAVRTDTDLARAALCFCDDADR